MKITLPKELSALSAAIDAKQIECDQMRSDIERAAVAALEGDRINSELQALSRKRAELKAHAFISRQPADLDELNAQEESLERASRAAREDGAAAAIAIELLKAKLEDTETAINDLAEERRAKAIAWLAECRERAIDRYVKLIADLGQILAEAAAADEACVRLGGDNRRHFGTWLKDEWHKTTIPMPYVRMEDFVVAGEPKKRFPFVWRRDKRGHGAVESEALLALLREVGFQLPPSPNEAPKDADVGVAEH